MVYRLLFMSEMSIQRNDNQVSLKRFSIGLTVINRPLDRPHDLLHELRIWSAFWVAMQASHGNQLSPESNCFM